MSEAIQPGMRPDGELMRSDAGMAHPDAEMLSAFTEQSLTKAEREEIVLHLAACGRCREVVFLAQQAATEERAVGAPFRETKPEEKARAWFADWRWAWIPVGALAAFVGVAAVMHFRGGAPETQMAKNATPTNTALRQAQPAPTASKDASPPQQRPVNDKTIPAPRSTITPMREQKEEAKVLDDKEARRRDEAVVTAGAVSPAPGGVVGGLAGGMGQGAAAASSVHGELTSRSNAQSAGGPLVANQYQQQNAPSQNTVQTADQLQTYDARKLAAAKSAPSTQTQTVMVQAEPQIAPAAPPEAKQSPITQAANETVEVQGRSLAKVKKAPGFALPSGLGVLSSAVSQGHTIALDASGKLFVSDDNGKEWKPVDSQWKGRAVLVRTRRVPASLAPAFGAGQSPGFELVTDKSQTWVSADGKKWTAEDPAVK